LERGRKKNIAVDHEARGDSFHRFFFPLSH